MKRIILLNCIFSISLINAAVSTDTVVETPEGSKEIGILKVGDKIICLNKNLLPKAKMVESIEEVETDSIIEITTEDDVVIRVSPNQRMFVPYKWVQVDQLSLGDVLLKKDRTFIRIKGICHKRESVKLRFITVEKHQNFLASSNGVLVHNGPMAAMAAYIAVKTSMYAALATAVAGTAYGAGVLIAGGSTVAGSTGATLAVGSGTGAGATTFVGTGAGAMALGNTGVAVVTASPLVAVTAGTGSTIAIGTTGVTIGTSATISSATVGGMVGAGVAAPLQAMSGVTLAGKIGTAAITATCGSGAGAVTGATITGVSAGATVATSVTVASVPTAVAGTAIATDAAATAIAAGGFKGAVAGTCVATAAYIESCALAAYWAAMALPTW